MARDGSENQTERGLSGIVCTECLTAPRLKSLDKNSGTQTVCDCDDVRKSLDSVPYELSVNDLPDDWVVVDGRSASQLATEVDALIAAGEYECPRCEDEFGMSETAASCSNCGYIPEEKRA
jgi:hypothetical protein